MKAVVSDGTGDIKCEAVAGDGMDGNPSNCFILASQQGFTAGSPSKTAAEVAAFKTLCSVRRRLPAGHSTRELREGKVCVCGGEGVADLFLNILTCAQY